MNLLTESSTPTNGGIASQKVPMRLSKHYYFNLTRSQHKIINMEEVDLNKKWDIHRVIQEAIKTSHTNPAPETLARLKNLEDNQSKVMEKIDDLVTSVNNMAVDIAGLPEKILEKADERYASKVTERAVYSLIGMIVSGVLYALLKLVIK